MDQNRKYKPFEDLEERCFKYALEVDRYIRKLPKDIPNIEHAKQLARSAGSVGANYIEANESLSKKDCVMRMKISKKETKESRFWLRLTLPLDPQLPDRDKFIQESNELMRIFGSMVEKMK